MKVYIEQPGEPQVKNIFDKETGEFIKAAPFHTTYPYPYGYILDTLAPDGDELDCYVISRQKFAVGSIVECEPIGLAEWFEDGEADHKILMSVSGESEEVTDQVKEKINYFAAHFFDDKPEKHKNSLQGAYYGKSEAQELIGQCRVLPEPA